MWRSYYLTFEGPHAKQGDRQEGARVAARHHRACSRSSRSSRRSSGVIFGVLEAPLRRRTASRSSRSGSHPVLSIGARAVRLRRARPRPRARPHGALGRAAPSASWALAQQPLRRGPLARLGRRGAAAPGLHADAEQVLRRRDLPGDHRRVRSCALRLVLAEMDTLDRRRPRQRRRRSSCARVAWINGRHRHVPRRRRRQLRRRGHAHGGRQAPHAADRPHPELRLRPPRRRRLLRHRPVLPPPT